MGCGQVVRHQVLVLAFGGSNPSIPATHRLDRLVEFLRAEVERIRILECTFGGENSQWLFESDVPMTINRQ